MIIRTDRLNLYPLNLDQLYLLSSSRNSLAHTMGWTLHNLKLSDANFQKEITSSLESFVIPQVKSHPDQYLWYTHWIIHHQEDNKDIGGIGTSGFPNENGEVMIGYYIDKTYERRGLATEAVNGLVHWMEKEPTLMSIIADTPKDYLGSQKVLQKNGFISEGEVKEGIRWRKITHR